MKLILRKNKLKNESAEMKPLKYRFFKQNYLYPIGSIDKRPEAHASVIIRGIPENNKEVLYCTWFCGTREGNIDVAIMFCTIRYTPNENPELIEFEYSTPKVIADDSDRACGNPVLFLDDNNVLHLWYAVFYANNDPQNRKGHRKILYKKSEDKGETWTEPVEFSDRDGLWVRNPVLVLNNGSWVLPMNDESTFIKKFKTYWSSRFAFSHDQGKTWEFSDLYCIKKRGMIQPSIVQFDDGEIYCVNRARNGYIVEMRSFDNGKTWTTPTKTKMPNPNSNAVILLRKDGSLILVYNPLKKGRYIISVAISRDRGKTWTHKMDLQNQKWKEFSYPCIAETPDELIHITYTYKRKTISHDVFKL